MHLLIFMLSIAIKKICTTVFRERFELLNLGLGQVGASTGRDNSSGVDLEVRRVVVVLDVVHVDRLGDLGQLVDAASVLQDVGVVLLDALDVALEVSVVDWIEANDGGPQADICLSQSVTDKIVRLAQDLLNAVQGIEQGVHVVLVRGLSGGKARLVYAVIDRVVDPLVDGIDLAAQLLGIEIEASLLGNQLVEGSVEHSDHFA